MRELFSWLRKCMELDRAIGQYYLCWPASGYIFSCRDETGPFLDLSCQYKRFLFCLGCSSRPCTKYFFFSRTLFQFLCPSRPASWAGSRAGSPISQYVSLVRTPMLTVILVKVANVWLVNMIYNCYGTDIVNIMQVYQPPSLVIWCTRRLT